MADAQPPSEGTSSTPPADSGTAPPSTPQAAPTDKPAADPVKATGGVTEPAKAAETPPAEPVKEPPKEEALFKLPEDFKPPEGAVKAFEDAFKGKFVDGKLSMSPQQVADLYVGMAREAAKGWDAQIQKLDTDNAAACKARFSAEELAAAESAVGFFSSYDPGFRDLAKRQLNDPTFTNAMRLVGELLSEDELGTPTPPPAPPKDNRPLRERAADALYGRKPS